jgi:hypothetical protein
MYHEEKEWISCGCLVALIVVVFVLMGFLISELIKLLI